MRNWWQLSSTTSFPCSIRSVNKTTGRLFMTQICLYVIICGQSCDENTGLIHHVGWKQPWVEVAEEMTELRRRVRPLEALIRRIHSGPGDAGFLWIILCHVATELSPESHETNTARLSVCKDQRMSDGSSWSNGVWILVSWDITILWYKCNCSVLMCITGQVYCISWHLSGSLYHFYTSEPLAHF